MTSPTSPDPVFAHPPDPGSMRSPEEVVAALRLLRAWASSPSYAAIARRINAAWRAAGRPAREWSTAKNTVADCFRIRPRPSDELLIAIVAVLHPDPSYVAQWRQALRVVRGEATAAAFVTATDRLPEDLPDFIGREIELAELGRMLDDSAARASAEISVIEGMPGVGKTALAVRAGHLLLRRQRCDQVLYVDLRGFHHDPRQPPADPAAVLGEFVRLLGMPAGQIQPPSLEKLATAYQQALRERRTLVVLDNAAGVDQVRPLVPDSTGCFTLITSRLSLAGLTGARRLPLEVFAAEEAVGLLRIAAGEQRYAADPGAAALIAELLGYLPLAMAVMASRIRSSPWPLTEFLGWLLNQREVGGTGDAAEASLRRLMADRVKLAAGLRVADRLRLAIDLSYVELSHGSRRLFRLLALHPGPDFDPYAAAALGNGDLAEVRRRLDALLAANLLQQRQPGRYLLHDVLRAYAADRAYDDEPGAARRAAITRLLDHYQQTAAAAMELCAPYEKERRPTPPATAVPRVTLAGVAAAEAWLAGEVSNLLACNSLAAAAGWPAHAVGFSLTLFPYLEERGRYADARALHTASLEAARSRADRVSEGQILINIGLSEFWRGRFDTAQDRLRQALALVRETGDRVGEGRALANLGEIDSLLGRYAEALDHFERGLAIARETGYRAGECRALNSVGMLHGQRGDFRAAIGYLRHALVMAEELGDQHSASRALVNLGLCYANLGRHLEAVDCHQRALTVFRSLSLRDSEGYVLDALGTDYQLMGRHDEALEHHRQAWAIALEIGNRMLEASAGNSIGEAMRSLRAVHDALTHHRKAWNLAHATGNQPEAARAHAGLGDGHSDLGHRELARVHWEEALAIYAELGVPEAGKTRAKLDALRQ